MTDPRLVPPQAAGTLGEDGRAWPCCRGCPTAGADDRRGSSPPHAPAARHARCVRRSLRVIVTVLCRPGCLLSFSENTEEARGRPLGRPGLHRPADSSNVDPVLPPKPKFSRPCHMTFQSALLIKYKRLTFSHLSTPHVLMGTLNNCTALTFKVLE